MSTRAGACAHCLRRSWLLAQLGPVLDYASGECGRMMDLLALEDAQLLTALGGSRRQELEARYARAALHEIAAAEGTQPVCRHDRGYPAGLRFAAAPRALHVAGGARRLEQLTSGADWDARFVQIAAREQDPYSVAEEVLGEIARHGQ